MQNPFESLSAQLARIEQMLFDLKHGVTSSAPSDEIGGIELAQQVTGLSKARIYALVSARAIVHSKRGNRLFFRRSELEAWVAKGKREEVAA